MGLREAPPPQDIACGGVGAFVLDGAKHNGEGGLVGTPPGAMGPLLPTALCCGPPDYGVSELTPPSCVQRQLRPGPRRR